MTILPVETVPLDSMRRRSLKFSLQRERGCKRGNVGGCGGEG